VLPIARFGPPRCGPAEQSGEAALVAKNETDSGFEVSRYGTCENPENALWVASF
jgi:hypothetical protein